MDNNKILLVCHGNKHSINGSNGDDKYPFMMSLKMLKNAVTLDMDPECEPDILENFNKPTSINENTFSLVCVIGWPMQLYLINFFDGIHPFDNNELFKLTGERFDIFIPNLIKVVNVNGYIVMNCSGELERFSSFLLETNISELKWADGTTLSEEELSELSIHTNNTKNNIHDTFDPSKINKLFGLFIRHVYPQLSLLQTDEDFDEYAQVFLSKYFRRMNDDNDDFTDIVENQIYAIRNNQCDYFVFKKTF